MKCMRVVLLISTLGFVNFLLSMDLPPIKAPLFGNDLNLENSDNIKRATESIAQLEFYDALSWEAKEVCDDFAQKACKEYGLKIPRSASFLCYRETRSAYTQAYIQGEPRALALFKSMDDKIAAERKSKPDIFKLNEPAKCCDPGTYTFCDSHRDEYLAQAIVRICKETELLPMSYAQMKEEYLPTAKGEIVPLAQRKFDEIHLILRMRHPSKTPLQVGDDWIWIEEPRAPMLGAIEAQELHDRNGGLDLCDDLNKLVLWANKASGKNIDQMSNADLMNNFLRILKGEKESQDLKR